MKIGRRGNFLCGAFVMRTGYRDMSDLFDPPIRMKHVSCRSCGYDLFGSKTRWCPECGAATPWARMPKRIWKEFVFFGAFWVLVATGMTYLLILWYYSPPGSWITTTDPLTGTTLTAPKPIGEKALHKAAVSAVVALAVCCLWFVWRAVSLRRRYFGHR